MGMRRRHWKLLAGCDGHKRWGEERCWHYFADNSMLAHYLTREGTRRGPKKPPFNTT